MDSHTLTPAEVGLIRWYRNLDQRIKNAITLWLATGETGLLIYELSHHLPVAA